MTKSLDMSPTCRVSDRSPNSFEGTLRGRVARGFLPSAAGAQATERIRVTSTEPSTQTAAATAYSVP